MASTWALLQLCAVAIMLQEWLGVTADPAAVLDCPAVFKNASTNPITYRLDSVEITNAGCNTPANVVFGFIPKGQTSLSQLCSSRYPPLTTCSDVTTSDTCGCVKQDGAVYTYKYTFPVDDSHVGGKIKTTFCAGNSTPFKENVSPSCNSISFTGDPEAPCSSSVFIVCIVFLGAAVILDAAIILAFYKINNENFEIPILAIVVLEALLWILVICILALLFKYKDLLVDDCDTGLLTGFGVAAGIMHVVAAFAIVLLVTLKILPSFDEDPTRVPLPKAFGLGLACGVHMWMITCPILIYIYFYRKKA